MRKGVKLERKNGTPIQRRISMPMSADFLCFFHFFKHYLFYILKNCIGIFFKIN